MANLFTTLGDRQSEELCGGAITRTDTSYTSEKTNETGPERTLIVNYEAFNPAGNPVPGQSGSEELYFDNNGALKQYVKTLGL